MFMADAKERYQSNNMQLHATARQFYWWDQRQDG
jgi:hypothetical protein